ncbi:hypothetical protein [Paenimyroides aestuarii]|uniref:Uncharacterized protein n=1 Tax=Paenimyroides aestuarii TaxID=2968490 RepID=A0ABY5NUU2_9FLAO|nr:hypothetical protein [Paenimyroides aestuarii]UUV22320.1 hypothetical protein NPX36_04595 [Paenimyroides aestuarii]
MKQYFLIAISSLGIYSNVNAQTVIEEKTASSASALLDFKKGTTNGIILPAVETLPTTPENGTFLFDARFTEKKVKMFENGAWVSLSEAGNTTTLVPYSGTVDNGKKTVIGAKESDADGVLVLESANKALVLPHVMNPHLTVKSPYPGMMCYDTVRNAVAVFDGAVWNYWK